MNFSYMNLNGILKTVLTFCACLAMCGCALIRPEREPAVPDTFAYLAGRDLNTAQIIAPPEPEAAVLRQQYGAAAKEVRLYFDGWRANLRSNIIPALNRAALDGDMLEPDAWVYRNMADCYTLDFFREAGLRLHEALFKLQDQQQARNLQGLILRHDHAEKTYLAAAAARAAFKELPELEKWLQRARQLHAYRQEFKGILAGFETTLQSRETEMLDPAGVLRAPATGDYDAVVLLPEIWSFSDSPELDGKTWKSAEDLERLGDWSMIRISRGLQQQEPADVNFEFQQQVSNARHGYYKVSFPAKGLNQEIPYFLIAGFAEGLLRFSINGTEVGSYTSPATTAAAIPPLPLPQDFQFTGREITLLVSVESHCSKPLTGFVGPVWIGTRK